MCCRRTVSVCDALLSVCHKHQMKAAPIRVRQYWVQPMLEDHEVFGDFFTLIPTLRREEARFYNFLRMSTSSFDRLLEKVHAPLLHTSFRKPIAPAERLAITLRYVCMLCFKCDKVIMHYPYNKA